MLLVVLAGLLALPVEAAPSVKEYAVAINQAGRQRMLSQRMSKEFLFVVMGIDAETNQSELAKTVKLFDSTLDRLLAGDAEVSMPPPPSDEIRAQLNVVKGIWVPFRATLEKGLATKPGPTELAAFSKESQHLLVEMDKAVSLYEKSSEQAGIQGTGAVVNVAGRQRMLSQRMTKDILLVVLGVETDAARKDLATAKDLFLRSLKGLAEGDASMHLPVCTNKVARQQLTQVEAVWGGYAPFVNQVIEQGTAPDAAALKQISEINRKLLIECQKVVSTFENQTY